MRRMSCLMGILFFSLSVGVLSPVRAATAPTTVTVPMRLDLNRPYIDVILTGPSGHSVKVHTWVDTGGGAILFSADLAKRLGLKPVAKASREEGEMVAPTTVPTLRLGGMTVKLTNARAFILTEEPQTLQHTDAEMALPGRFLRHYTVVFDYPRHKFTIAEPGKLHPQGTEMKSYIGDSGMPVVWASVGGKTYGFLMDTGGQSCMISDAVLKGWMRRHPSWLHVAGAYGPADMLLGKMEAKLEMLRVGEMQLGPFSVKNVDAVSRPLGTYEKWMSNIVGKPVVGSIAGNVLRDFRVTIDYPISKVYLQRETTSDNTAFDIVGLILEPAANGAYEIAGTAADVHGVEAGDRLLAVDDHRVAGVPFYEVVQWLSGHPGDMHTLMLGRHGKQFVVRAAVQPIL